MNITEFLLARIAEDEAVARDAHYEGQCWVPEEEAVVAADRDLDPVLFLDRKCDATHAANWSPARVLAECEAKRRIVREHSDVDPCDAHDGATLETVDCDTLRFLASVYADHEDFQEEWRV